MEPLPVYDEKGDDDALLIGTRNTDISPVLSPEIQRNSRLSEALLPHHWWTFV
jgi:hypothetical protein